MSEFTVKVKQGFKKDKKILILVNVAVVATLLLSFVFQGLGVFIPMVLFGSISGGAFVGWNGTLIQHWFD